MLSLAALEQKGVNRCATWGPGHEVRESGTRPGIRRRCEERTFRRKQNIYEQRGQLQHYRWCNTRSEIKLKYTSWIQRNFRITFTSHEINQRFCILMIWLSSWLNREKHNTTTTQTFKVNLPRRLSWILSEALEHSSTQHRTSLVTNPTNPAQPSGTVHHPAHTLEHTPVHTPYTWPFSRRTSSTATHPCARELALYWEHTRNLSVICYRGDRRAQDTRIIIYSCKQNSNISTDRALQFIDLINVCRPRDNRQTTTAWDKPVIGGRATSVLQTLSSRHTSCLADVTNDELVGSFI